MKKSSKTLGSGLLVENTLDRCQTKQFCFLRVDVDCLVVGESQDSFQRSSWKYSENRQDNEVKPVKA